jgi:hypothetical protein
MILVAEIANKVGYKKSRKYEVKVGRVHRARVLKVAQVEKLSNVRNMFEMSGFWLMQQQNKKGTNRTKINE